MIKWKSLHTLVTLRRTGWNRAILKPSGQMPNYFLMGPLCSVLRLIAREMMTLCRNSTGQDTGERIITNSSLWRCLFSASLSSQFIRSILVFKYNMINIPTENCPILLCLTQIAGTECHLKPLQPIRGKHCHSAHTDGSYREPEILWTPHLTQVQGFFSQWHLQNCTPKTLWYISKFNTASSWLCIM